MKTNAIEEPRDTKKKKKKRRHPLLSMMASHRYERTAQISSLLSQPPWFYFLTLAGSSKAPTQTPQHPGKTCCQCTQAPQASTQQTSAALPNLQTTSVATKACNGNHSSDVAFMPQDKTSLVSFLWTCYSSTAVFSKKKMCVQIRGSKHTLPRTRLHASAQQTYQALNARKRNAGSTF